ncbi:unnamed protein product, partial [marine sediment metagenome]
INVFPNEIENRDDIDVNRRGNPENLLSVHCKKPRLQNSWIGL